MCECVNVRMFECLNVWMFERCPADELMFHIFRLHTRLTHHQTGLDHVEEYSLDQETYPEHYVPHRYRIFFPQQRIYFSWQLFFSWQILFFPEQQRIYFSWQLFFSWQILFFPEQQRIHFSWLPDNYCSILSWQRWNVSWHFFPDILFVPCQPLCFSNDSGGVFAEHVHGLAPTEKALLLQAHVR